MFRLDWNLHGVLTVIEVSMAYKRNPRNDREYRAMSNALKKETAKHNLVCWICGRPIDTSLHWKEPMSFTADHYEPLANGGALYGKLYPAHRACNSRRGNRSKVKIVRPPVTSRRW